MLRRRQSEDLLVRKGSKLKNSLSQRPSRIRRCRFRRKTPIKTLILFTLLFFFVFFYHSSLGLPLSSDMRSARAFLNTSPVLRVKKLAGSRDDNFTEGFAISVENLWRRPQHWTYVRGVSIINIVFIPYKYRIYIDISNFDFPRSVPDRNTQKRHIS